MLASSSASQAQYLRQYAYTSGAYVDCYYDPSMVCGRVSYAAASVTPYGAYAAINGVVQPPYLATAPLFWRGLRGGDWVAIHGAGTGR